jgi:DUF971 family protein
LSFWDSIKPAKKVAVPTAVNVSADQRALELKWDDGSTKTLSAQRLRQQCPCAECVEEFTGRRVLDPAAIDANMKIVEVQQVGNYALSFTFGDLHRTGIFNWEYLRSLT